MQQTFGKGPPRKLVCALVRLLLLKYARRSRSGIVMRVRHTDVFSSSVPAVKVSPQVFPSHILC